MRQPQIFVDQNIFIFCEFLSVSLKISLRNRQQMYDNMVMSQGPRWGSWSWQHLSSSHIQKLGFKSAWSFLFIFIFETRNSTLFSLSLFSHQSSKIRFCLQVACSDSEPDAWLVTSFPQTQTNACVHDGVGNSASDAEGRDEMLR